MSLINQVLKDLEKRHAGADASALGRAVRPLPEERRRRGRWIGLSIIVIALLAGSGWWWTMRERSVPPPLAAQKAPAARPAPITVATPQPSQPAVARMDATAGIPAAVAASPAPVNGATVSALGSANATPPLAASAAPKSAELSTSQLPGSAPRMGHANTVNQVSAPLAGAAAPLSTAEHQPRALPVAGGPEDKTGTSGSSTTQAPQPIDTEASPAKPRPTPVRSRPRMVVETTPKIVASAHSTEYPDAKTPSDAANIEKQVRPQSERERAEDKFQQGMNALQNGNVAEAEVALNEALRVDPMADKARQALLGIYVQAGRREQAERLLEDRLQVDGKHIGFAVVLARLQLEHGSNSEALATLQRSAQYGETSADYQAMLANALARVARHKDAAERFAIASQLAPRNPLWQMGLGVELRAENRKAEARAAFQRARELGGLNAQLTAYLDQQLRELQ